MKYLPLYLLFALLIPCAASQAEQQNIITLGPCCATEQQDASPDLMPPPPPPPPPQHPGEHLERFMNRLQKRDPAEYDRLEALRTSDPEAFRDELSDRLHSARMKHRGRENRPGESSFPPSPPPACGRIHPAMTPELEALVASYHQATSPDQRDLLKQQIQQDIAILFDEHTRMQLEQIAQIEKRLDKMRKILEHRQNKREHILDFWFRKLTRQPDP